MIFIDTNIFLYAAGKDHPLRKPCQQFLHDIAATRTIGITSSEVVQEILYVLTRRGLQEKALKLAGYIIGLFPELLPVTRSDMESACHILQAWPSVPVRDAVHVGTMLNNNLNRIISADRHFDDISSIKRIDPSTWD